MENNNSEFRNVSPYELKNVDDVIHLLEYMASSSTDLEDFLERFCELMMSIQDDWTTRMLSHPDVEDLVLEAIDLVENLA